MRKPKRTPFIQTASALDEPPPGLWSAGDRFPTLSLTGEI